MFREFVQLTLPRWGNLLPRLHDGMRWNLGVVSCVCGHLLSERMESAIRVSECFGE